MLGVYWYSQKKQQEKIVIIIKGSIVDFCIDLRKKSKTFLKVFKFYLKENSILYIPKGFAHGYLGIKNENKIVYFLSNYRQQKYERGLNLKDNKINLKIGKKNLIISKKDQTNMYLDNFEKEIRTL